MELLICYIRMFWKETFGRRMAIDCYLSDGTEIPGKIVQGVDVLRCNYLSALNLSRKAISRLCSFPRSFCSA